MDRFRAAVVSLTLMLSGTVACRSLTAQDDLNSPVSKLASSPTTGMKLTLIRAGGFEMGSLVSEDGHLRSEQQHIARITRPFYLALTEVTQSEYEAVMESNPSSFSRSRAEAQVARGVAGQQPVENVSWYDAIEFCNAMSEKDGLKPYYELTEISRAEGPKSSIQAATVKSLGGSGYRLPTEAEWEYACRAGTTTAYSSGDTPRMLAQAGWYGGEKGNSGQVTHPVGQKPGNDFGLVDMHGNVSEWCQDWYDYYSYDRAPMNDPTGPSGGSERIVRGGSWNDDAGHCRAAFRGAVAPGTRRQTIGFRVARSVPLPPAKPAAGVAPYRLVIDLRDGDTVDVFRNETYDSVDDARARLRSAKLFGRPNNIRIIDSNGDQMD